MIQQPWNKGKNRGKNMNQLTIIKMKTKMWLMQT